MHWKEAIPRSVIDVETFLYFEEQNPYPVKVDCSFGCSPFGAPECVREICRFPKNLIGQYSFPSQILAQPVAEFWGDCCNPDQLVFANGTDTILVVLAKTIGSERGQLLGLAPQFTDAPVHFQFSGMKARFLPLNAPEYAISASRIAESLTPEDTLIYLDRPHNPTGQALSLKDLELLLDACRRNGTLLIVDEAYGDFIDESQSALHLQSPDLVVLRTFSKGWGMAGLRAGFARIGDPDLLKWYRRVSPPFTVGAKALTAVPLALKHREFMPEIREKVRQVKTELMGLFAKYPQISVARTEPTTVIMLVSHAAPDADLYGALAAAGIASSPGRGFVNLQNNSVRIRIPRPDQLEIFAQCWGKAMEVLG